MSAETCLLPVLSIDLSVRFQKQLLDFIYVPDACSILECIQYLHNLHKFDHLKTNLWCHQDSRNV